MIPYTMEMYKAQLQKMMNSPMAQGQPMVTQQAGGNGMMDKLRAAATALTASTALAGSTL